MNRGGVAQCDRHRLEGDLPDPFAIAPDVVGILHFFQFAEVTEIVQAEKSEDDAEAGTHLPA